MVLCAVVQEPPPPSSPKDEKPAAPEGAGKATASMFMKLCILAREDPSSLPPLKEQGKPQPACS